jgi:hypothetical protein
LLPLNAVLKTVIIVLCLITRYRIGTLAGRLVYGKDFC